MAKIRWSEKDNVALQKAVKNFNAKIGRLQKRADMQGVILPEKISTKDLRNRIGTRKELEREMRSLHAFSKRGSEKPYTNPNGVTMTKWEVRDNRQRNRWINKELEKQREKLGELEVTSQGVKQDLKRKEMGSVRMNELAPRAERSDTVRTAKEWKMHRQATLEKSRAEEYRIKAIERWRANYIKSLKESGLYTQELRDKIMSKTVDEFEEIMYSEQEAEVAFQYLEFEDLVSTRQILMNIWK